MVREGWGGYRSKGTIVYMNEQKVSELEILCRSHDHTGHPSTQRYI